MPFKIYQCSVNPSLLFPCSFINCTALVNENLSSLLVLVLRNSIFNSSSWFVFWYWSCSLCACITQLLHGFIQDEACWNSTTMFRHAAIKTCKWCGKCYGVPRWSLLPKVPSKKGSFGESLWGLKEARPRSTAPSEFQSFSLEAFQAFPVNDQNTNNRRNPWQRFPSQGLGNVNVSSQLLTSDERHDLSCSFGLGACQAFLLCTYYMTETSSKQLQFL